MNSRLVEVENLKTYFKKKTGILSGKPMQIKAVDDISVSVYKGETLGLVGESGCGKSTLGRSILRLVPLTGGSVRFDGKDITDLAEKQMRAYRKEMQLIFQDPYSSLNPRMTIGRSVEAPLKVYGEADREERVQRALIEVGLDEQVQSRFPHEFSGGQRQRIAIARALILNPKFVVCDEPVSALDVSVQAQVLNLMKELQEKRALTYLFISHDLSVVKYVSDRIAVMYLGEIVELADTKELFEDPAHPYTQTLLSAVLQVSFQEKKHRVKIMGEIPDVYHAPQGCKFHPRCPRATDECKNKRPVLRALTSGHSCACHHVQDI